MSLHIASNGWWGVHIHTSAEDGECDAQVLVPLRARETLLEMKENFLRDSRKINGASFSQGMAHPAACSRFVSVPRCRHHWLILPLVR